jgi:hypothetical protein
VAAGPRKAAVPLGRVAASEGCPEAGACPAAERSAVMLMFAIDQSFAGLLNPRTPGSVAWLPVVSKKHRPEKRAPNRREKLGNPRKGGKARPGNRQFHGLASSTSSLFRLYQSVAQVFAGTSSQPIVLSHQGKNPETVPNCAVMQYSPPLGSTAAKTASKSSYLDAKSKS